MDSAICLPSLPLATLCASYFIALWGGFGMTMLFSNPGMGARGRRKFPSFVLKSPGKIFANDE
jgi:hypothetical protein